MRRSANARLPRIAAGLAFAAVGAFSSLAPSGCDGDAAKEEEQEACKVDLADGIREPHRNARQSCWMLRSNGNCDDVGRDAICVGTTLSCPAGQVLGSECPGDPYRDPVWPDAGARIK
jgi:hypothetical protein